MISSFWVWIICFFFCLTLMNNPQKTILTILVVLVWNHLTLWFSRTKFCSVLLAWIDIFFLWNNSITELCWIVREFIQHELKIKGEIVFSNLKLVTHWSNMSYREDITWLCVDTNLVLECSMGWYQHEKISSYPLGDILMFCLRKYWSRV